MYQYEIRVSKKTWSVDPAPWGMVRHPITHPGYHKKEIHANLWRFTCYAPSGYLYDLGFVEIFYADCDETARQYARHWFHIIRDMEKVPRDWFTRQQTELENAALAVYHKSKGCMGRLKKAAHGMWELPPEGVQ